MEEDKEDCPHDDVTVEYESDDCGIDIFPVNKWKNITCKNCQKFWQSKPE